jgi:hypothetical protein
MEISSWVEEEKAKIATIKETLDISERIKDQDKKFNKWEDKIKRIEIREVRY